MLALVIGLALVIAGGVIALVAKNWATALVAAGVTVLVLASRGPLS